MDRILSNGEELGYSSGTVAVTPGGEEQDVGVRVIRDTGRDMLLIERLYENATLVSEFEIVNEDTVRALKPLEQYPDYVLKAVVATGHEHVHEPDWP